jgi:hypothetical protein
MEAIIFFIITGLFSVYYFIKFLGNYKLVSETDTTPIRMLNKGFYEVKGKIVPMGNQLISPFTGKECVYYQFTIEQKKQTGKKSRWIKIVSDTKFSRLGIDDGTGIAILDLNSAHLQIKTNLKDSSGLFNTADERELAVLEKYEQTNKTWLFEKPLRYSEKMLEVGQELYVLGEVNERDEGYPVFKRWTRPYFVSDKREKELLRMYKTGLIWAGIVFLISASIIFGILHSNYHI